MEGKRVKKEVIQERLLKKADKLNKEMDNIIKMIKERNSRKALSR